MGMKESVNEFVTDFKAMVKTKDMTRVNQKYLQPTWAQTKVIAGKTWDVVVENTPKVVAAGKEVAHKAKEMVNEYAAKKAASKSNPQDPANVSNPSNSSNPLNPSNPTESKPTEPKNKV